MPPNSSAVDLRGGEAVGGRQAATKVNFTTGSAPIIDFTTWRKTATRRRGRLCPTRNMHYTTFCFPINRRRYDIRHINHMLDLMLDNDTFIDENNTLL